MNHIWIGLVAGFLPYSITKRREGKEKQILEVRALFWKLRVCWQHGQCSWKLYIPLIEHLQR